MGKADQKSEPDTWVCDNCMFENDGFEGDDDPCVRCGFCDECGMETTYEHHDEGCSKA